MTTFATVAEAPSPGRLRWLVWVVIVFGVQVGLILWLSDRHPAPRRPTLPVPVLTEAGSLHPDFLALSDPTLFALPHLRGFSGEAWLRPPVVAVPNFEWTEEPRWLALPTNALGVAFREFMATNQFNQTPMPARAQPEPDLPPPATWRVLPDGSSLRLEGELAARKLLNPPALPPQPASELLAPTVVQAMVDGFGWPVSVVLLSGSGSRSADQWALEQTRTFRFSSVPGVPELALPRDKLSWGQVVFEWLTIPVTNSPTAAPIQ